MIFVVVMVTMIDTGVFVMTIFTIAIPGWLLIVTGFCYLDL